MKKHIILSLIALTVAGTAYAQSTTVPSPATFTDYSAKRAVSGYIEPSVIWMPGNSGLSGAIGGQLSGGVALYENHLLGLDLAYFQADYDHGPGKVQFIPLTVDYQYVLPVSEYFSLRGGAFVGAMFEKSKGRPDISSKSRTAFTGGLSIGADFIINKYVSIGISGKWMHVNKVNDLAKRDMPLIGIDCLVRF